MKYLFRCVLALGVWATACSRTPDNSTASGQPDPIPGSSAVAARLPLSDGLQMWTNIEQIEYCVPVPADEYLPDPGAQTRGQFLFVKPGDTASYVFLRGLFRSDEAVPVSEYYSATYSGEEEAEGKVVLSKELLESRGMFWAEGYWSNFPNHHFLEITWLRSGEVITLEAMYPNADSAVWGRRKDIILSYDSNCQ